MTPVIRPYRPTDAADLADIFVRSVSVIGSRCYSAEETAAWLSDHPTPSDIHKKNGDGRMVFVAADESNRAIAWIDLEPVGHIDMLFCAPEWTGQGIASLLYGALESAARRQGLTRLRVEASAGARPVFERWGFVTIARRNFVMAGVAMHNFAMAKVL